MKWYIVTIMNNKKYFYKSKGPFVGAMIWTSNPRDASNWNSKGAVEFYMTRNHITKRGIIQGLKDNEE